jgi:CheY-like chemotaxis protein
METPKTILLVEDEPALCDLVSLAINNRIPDCQIVTAEDGLEALELLEKIRPGVIILDILLPRMNGLEFIRRLQERTEWAEIPVMVTTALGYPEIVRQVAASGVRDFIVKPYDVLVLVERIQAALMK